MKNELLMRAIGELNDELIEEAHLPLERRKPVLTVIARYGAIAACFIAVLTAVLMPHSSHGFTVSVNGTSVAEAPIELSLISPMRQRASIGTEIPLTIANDGEAVTLTVGDGGAILLEDGSEYTELTVSEDTQLIWLVDVSRQSTFELTMNSSSTSVILTASVSYDNNTIAVAAQRK